MIYPVLLSGGSGTRLWPLSRKAHPKQMLALTGDEPMIIESLKRAQAEGFGPSYVIASASHEELLADLLSTHGLHQTQCLLEPVARNTAVACAVAALAVAESDPDGVVAILPSDHLIRDTARFQADLLRAESIARAGAIVTFGIQPDRPHTGYGYIRQGAPLPGSTDVFKVDRFLEKPELSTAKQLLEAGGHVWNSGMFVYHVATLLEEFATLAPDILDAGRKALSGAVKSDHARILGAELAQSPSISFDYAIMEKTSRAAVLPVNFGWSDVGAWDAVHELVQHDGDGNGVKGSVWIENSRQCLVQGDQRLVALVGCDDLIVVDTPDALLVMARNAAQDIKKITSRLEAERKDLQ